MGIELKEEDTFLNLYFRFFYSRDHYITTQCIQRNRSKSVQISLL